MTRIAILDDYHGVALECADWAGLEDSITVFRDHLTDESALADRLQPFDIIVCMRERTPFPRSLLQRLPNLRLLATTGMRNLALDIAAANDLGIIVTGTQGLGIQAAEMAWALILACARHIPREDRAIRTGKWQTSIGDDMAGSTLGIIGLGKLGERVAKVGLAFEMDVVAWSQNLTQDRCNEVGVRLAASKDDLLRQSDYVSLHVVLSDRTRGLIGVRELSLMKPTAYLINTARGPIVDESALVTALQERRIAGAGLDVFDEEPIRPDHPLLALDNTVLTPHLGFVSRNAYAIYYGGCAEDIRAYLSGNPIRILTPSDGWTGAQS